jgi:hypothetical protein
LSTFNDVATDTLTSIGQLGVGQSASPEMMQQALRVANRMLQKWSLQRLYLWWIPTRQYTLVSMQQNYGFGPTGPDFVLATRPNLVETCAAIYPGSLSERPMNILDRPKWGAIPDKGATCGVNGVPQDCWIEYTYPNLTLHFWPIPSSAGIGVKLGTWEVLQQFATIFDVLSMPFGYEEALQQNLAFELASFYDMPIAASLSQLAADALLRVQQLNAQSIGGAFGESETLYEPSVGQPKPGPEAAAATPQQ